jgi:hypothetical protein
MITVLVLIVIPTLIILTRLENSRSRRKVSVDGFKMINGHVVGGGAEDRHAGSAVDTDPTTSLRWNRNSDRDADRQAG